MEYSPAWKLAHAAVGKEAQPTCLRNHHVPSACLYLSRPLRAAGKREQPEVSHPAPHAPRALSCHPVPYAPVESPAR